MRGSALELPVPPPLDKQTGLFRGQSTEHLGSSTKCDAHPARDCEPGPGTGQVRDERQAYRNFDVGHSHVASHQQRESGAASSCHLTHNARCAAQMARLTSQLAGTAS